MGNCPLPSVPSDLSFRDRSPTSVLADLSGDSFPGEQVLIFSAKSPPPKPDQPFQVVCHLFSADAGLGGTIAVVFGILLGVLLSSAWGTAGGSGGGPG